MPVATVEIAVHSLFNGCYDDVTVVLNYWWSRLDHLSDTLYLYGAVRGYFEIFRHQMIGVAPSVVATVDGVGIDEGCVAAAVGDIAGVDTFLKRDICAATGDDGQGGGVNL